MQHCIIYTDGGSRGNPGRAGIGFVIWDSKYKKIAEHKEYIGITTNNVAEYTALIKGLEKCKSVTKEEVSVFMDSELIVRQMQGKYKVKTEHIKPLFSQVKKLELSFKKVTFTHVPRENVYQKEADRLVNEALDEI